MAKRNLAGLRAILTGASSGIGRELALELARRGVQLVLTARREDRLQTLGDEITTLGGNAVIVPGDITDASLRRGLLEAAQSQLGGLDLLINNAGMAVFGPFRESDPDRLRRILEVDFLAPVELIRAALPLIKQGQRPMILNIGSVLGHFAVPNKSEYCASKFALHGFSDALRLELLPEGIDVLLVSPSTTATEFFDKAEADPARRPRRGMSPAAVARRTVRAIAKGKRELILSPGGKLAVWCDRLLPGLMSRVLSRFG
jgi:short-subunit dehydrogenase